jgi:CRISPR-associated protein Cas2
MVVLILERVPIGLRGELSRWMLEPRAGVFVGSLSAIVRDKLWQKAARDSKGGAGMLIFASKSEQGFSVRSFGDTTRALLDWEGLLLVHVPKRTREASASVGGDDQTDGSLQFVPLLDPDL